MTFLSYGRQVIDREDVESVTRALQGDFLTTGPTSALFEEALAYQLQSSHVTVCSSGTAALHLAFLALQPFPHDRCAAIVPTVTFVATANTAHMAGLHVVFSDVDPDTGLMRACDLEDAVNRCHTMNVVPYVVVPVHMAGQTVEMSELIPLAKRHGCAVIVDAAHALGSEEADAISVGSDQSAACMTCFSFHPVKTITTGEGGAISTASSELAQKLRWLRNHGILREPDFFHQKDLAWTDADLNVWYYELHTIAPNYRLSDVHCALGLSQLRKLDRFLDIRADLVAHYYAGCLSLAPALVPLKNLQRPRTGWHLFAVLVDFHSKGTTRCAVMKKLHQLGIGTQVHYIPVHTHPFYQKHSPTPELPGAAEYYRRALSLPLSAAMTRDDVDRVVDAVARVLA